jgi:hypothetical protein
LLAAGIGLLVLAGCGGGSGVEEGATVRVYAVASLCAEAKAALTAADPKAGGVKVRVACLPPSSEGRGGRLDLAAIGAGARRAVEDTTTVAYLAEPGRATSFSEPILDAAEIPTITGSSGSRSMIQVLDALSSRADDEAPRASVWDVR